jgi:hypothetical protein
MIKLEAAISSLADNRVDFVIVGGVAIKIHSSAYVTADLDFCYARTKENFTKIVAALSQFKPRPRNFPEDLPYFFDERTLQNATNFTFETTIGDIDLLGEVAGVGTYAEVEKASEIFDLYGREIRVLSIEALIKAKRAAGRTKDLLVLPELEALREALSDDEEE